MDEAELASWPSGSSRESCQETGFQPIIAVASCSCSSFQRVQCSDPFVSQMFDCLEDLFCPAKEETEEWKTVQCSACHIHVQILGSGE